MSNPDSTEPTEEQKKLIEEVAFDPSAPLPVDREAKRQLVERMFKDVLTPIFGRPSPKTVAEFEKEIDDHNAGVKQKKETNESQESV